MNWIGNNLNWLIYVFVLVIPVMSSVGRWLQQQAVKKKAEAEQRRRSDSQLRTGRSEPSSDNRASRSPAGGQPGQTAEASDTERETFAERRRRQIEELKRRQEAAQRQRDAAQRTPSQPSPVPGPVPTPAPQQRRRVPVPVEQPTMRAAAAVEQPSAEVESLAQKFERRAAAEHARRGPAAPIVAGVPFGLTLNRHTLRQAVVLAEVLAPPVGLRDDAQRPV